MATFTWTLQGSTDTTIDSGDTLQFAGPDGFDSKITVGEYNDGTYVKSSSDTDDSSGNTPNNVKFISQSGGTSGASQADWGDGTEDLGDITDAEATLKINFSDASSVATSGALYYAYDGTTTTAAPSGVDFRAAEVGDTNFTEAEGSGDALSMADQAAATSHDFYIAVSSGPTSIGAKSFKTRIELTYA